MIASTLLTLLLASSLAALFAAAMIDLWCRIVPNRLVILVACSGVAMRLLSSPGLIWLSLLIAALIFVVLGRLSHHDWMGGGDAKMIAAVTLLFPPANVLTLLLDIAMAGGLMSCAYLATRFAMTRILASRHFPVDGRNAMRGLDGLFGLECMRIFAGEPMPYALAVLGGVVYRIFSEAIECSSAISCSF